MMPGDEINAHAERAAQGGRLAERELRHLVGQIVREVPGVADEPRPGQIHVRLGSQGITVDCAVTACHGVALHELGLTIQIALAEALHRAGSRVQAVNVTIQDIDDPVR